MSRYSRHRPMTGGDEGLPMRPVQCQRAQSAYPGAPTHKMCYLLSGPDGSSSQRALENQRITTHNKHERTSPPALPGTSETNPRKHPNTCKEPKNNECLGVCRTCPRHFPTLSYRHILGVPGRGRHNSQNTVKIAYTTKHKINDAHRNHHQDRVQTRF